MKTKEPVYHQTFANFWWNLCIGWWLDTLLKRKSDTWFTRSFEERYGWFLERHELRLVENGFLWNLAQIYLRAKLITVRNSDIEMQIHHLVDTVMVRIRRAKSGGRWKSLFDMLPDAESTLTWDRFIELLDERWQRVSDGALEE